MRKMVFAAIAALVLVLGGLLAGGTSASGSDGNDVLEWDVMAGVAAPFTSPPTGPTNPIRGLGGGGVPWSVDRARGKLRSDGRLKLKVEGFLLPPTGATRSPPLVARVTCLTPDEPVNGETVSTAPVATDRAGDAKF